MGGKSGGADVNMSSPFSPAGNVSSADYQSQVARAAADTKPGQTGGINYSYRPMFENNRNLYGDEQSWYNNYGGSQNPQGSAYDNKFSRDVFTAAYGTYKPPAAPAPAPAPAAAAPPPPPADTTPPPVDTTPPPDPLNPGGPIDQPLGDALGGAILNPPKYWIGGMGDYSKAKKQTGDTAGSLTTTQT